MNFELDKQIQNSFLWSFWSFYPITSFYLTNVFLLWYTDKALEFHFYLVFATFYQHVFICSREMSNCTVKFYFHRERNLHSETENMKYQEIHCNTVCLNKPYSLHWSLSQGVCIHAVMQGKPLRVPSSKHLNSNHTFSIPSLVFSWQYRQFITHIQQQMREPPRYHRGAC